MRPESTSKEFSILSYIDQNSDATQRDLSEYMGVSLGTINILMKKLVRKGLIKIERLQPNSVKYFLTPSGIANKIERTYGYIVRTYRELVLFEKQLALVLVAVQKHYPTKGIWVFGPTDEFFKIMEGLIHTERVLFPIQMAHTLEQVQEECTIGQVLVLVWREEDAASMKQAGFTTVNVLQGISYSGIQG